MNDLDKVHIQHLHMISGGPHHSVDSAMIRVPSMIRAPSMIRVPSMHYSLHHLIHKAHKMGRRLYAVFIDFVKGFDLSIHFI